MLRKIFYIAGFQACWFASILGAGAGYLYAGPAIVFVYAFIHLQLVEIKQKEVVRLLVAAGLGAIADSLLVVNGSIDFEAGKIGLVPLWMIMLWVAFAVAIPGTFAALRRRYVLAAIIGLVGGPLSYMAGESLGAIELTGAHWINTALIALEWACGMPLLVYLTERAESWNNFRQLKTEFRESGEVA